MTDASVLWLRGRALQSTVDGAALAGAQAVDLGAVYAGEAHGDLPLASTATVRRAVRRYLAATPSDDRLPACRLTSTAVDRPVVTVAARSTVTLPFTSLITGRGVVVRADASAVLRVPYLCEMRRRDRSLCWFLLLRGISWAAAAPSACEASGTPEDIAGSPTRVAEPLGSLAGLTAVDAVRRTARARA